MVKRRLSHSLQCKGSHFFGSFEHLTFLRYKVYHPTDNISITLFNLKEDLVIGKTCINIFSNFWIGPCNLAYWNMRMLQKSLSHPSIQKHSQTHTHTHTHTHTQSSNFLCGDALGFNWLNRDECWLFTHGNWEPFRTLYTQTMILICLPRTLPIPLYTNA